MKFYVQLSKCFHEGVVDPENVAKNMTTCLTPKSKRSELSQGGTKQLEVLQN